MRPHRSCGLLWIPTEGTGRAVPGPHPHRGDWQSQGQTAAQGPAGCDPATRRRGDKGLFMARQGKGFSGRSTKGHAGAQD